MLWQEHPAPGSCLGTPGGSCCGLAIPPPLATSICRGTWSLPAWRAPNSLAWKLSSPFLRHAWWSVKSFNPFKSSSCFWVFLIATAVEFIYAGALWSVYGISLNGGQRLPQGDCTLSKNATSSFKGPAFPCHLIYCWWCICDPCLKRHGQNRRRVYCRWAVKHSVNVCQVVCLISEFPRFQKTTSFVHKGIELGKVFKASIFLRLELWL